MPKEKTLPRPPKPFFISREERRAMFDEMNLRCSTLPGTVIISGREDANKPDLDRLADIHYRL
jgi:hypothetical protein